VQALLAFEHSREKVWLWKTDLHFLLAESDA